MEINRAVELASEIAHLLVTDDEIAEGLIFIQDSKEDNVTEYTELGQERFNRYYDIIFNYFENKTSL